MFGEARNFLRDNATRTNFFLWLDCFDPHEPWDAPPEFVLKYDKTPGYDGRVDPRAFGPWRNSKLTDAAVKRIRATYAAKVSRVDHWLGILLDTLSETGLQKNTAIILTSDHGTNDGTCNGFGKSVPPREPEARTPPMISVPGAGAGVSDIIAQPQDLFATITAIAGILPSQQVDSHDILTPAREGRSGPRRIAVCGRPPGERDILVTAFDGQWCLEVAADPGKCRLVRIGETEDVSAENPNRVEVLRNMALDEYARSGAEPAVMRWLRAEGTVSFPETFTPHRSFPLPAGYTQYFKRLYHGEFPGLK